MENLTIKCYKDGDEIIVSFSPATAEVSDIIKSVLTEFNKKDTEVKDIEKVDPVIKEQDEIILINELLLSLKAAVNHESTDKDKLVQLKTDCLPAIKNKPIYTFNKLGKILPNMVNSITVKYAPQTEDDYYKWSVYIIERILKSM